MLRDRQRQARQKRASDEQGIHRALHQRELAVRAQPVAFEHLLGQCEIKAIVERGIRMRNDRLGCHQPQF